MGMILTLFIRYIFSSIDIQWTDTERILSNLIDSQTKKRLEYHDIHHRYQRLIDWFENFLHVDLNNRLDGLSLETTLVMLKDDIANLLKEKNRHVNDLVVAARVHQNQSIDPTQIQTMKQHIDHLERLTAKADEHVSRK
jgi:hypothetical protein